MEDLGRDRAVQRLTGQLQEFLRGELTSGAFAVVGPWGSGKTWLLQQALGRVAPEKEERISIVPFTPWMYADEAAIFEGFAVLLLRQTLRKEQVRAPLAAGLRLLGPSAKAPGVDLSGVFEASGALLATDHSPERVRQILERALARKGRRLLVVMDDLDRLDPTELLTVFKLLRLISDVPGMAYVLVFDEDTILQLLMQTPLAQGSEERARQYLEKLITRRTDVPPLSASQMRSLLQPLLLQALARPAEVADGEGFRLGVPGQDVGVSRLIGGWPPRAEWWRRVL